MFDSSPDNLEETLEKRFRLLYSAYEYLRQNDLTSLSSTSDLLRFPDYELIQRKVREEVAELSGVLEGTHSHESPAYDFLLETHELLYWLLVACVSSHFAYSSLLPHKYLVEGYRDPVELDDLIDSLERFAVLLALNTHCDRAAALVQGLHLIGQACRMRDTSPLDVLQRDVTEMKSRPYVSFLFDEEPGDGQASQH